MEFVEGKPVFRMSKDEIRIIAEFLNLLNSASSLDFLSWDEVMNDHEWRVLTRSIQGDKSYGDFYDIEIIK